MCATHHLCICTTCLLCVSCVVQILWLRYDQAKQKYMEAREKLKEADEKLAQRKAQLQEDTGPLRCVGWWAVDISDAADSCSFPPPHRRLEAHDDKVERNTRF